MEDYKKQFVLNMLAYAVQRDVSPEQLCKLSGVDFKALKGKAEFIITPKQFNALWLNAVHLTSDQAFGLHFGESLQLAALGVVGQIIQASKTTGEALTLAAQSIHLITDVVSMEVARKNKKIIIQFHADKNNQDSNPEMLQQLIDFFMVFTIHELDGLIFKKIEPLKVKCSTNKLVATEEYERILRCRPQHKTDDCCMEFDGHMWDEPIITANYELQSHLLRMTRNNTPAKKEILMSERIVNHLTANAYLGIATLEGIASNFNISPRTLQRKLYEEGVSYQQLADSVRKSIALHYLQSGNYPVKEISYILGYNELSAFTRAFKRWTGRTPVDYQKKRND
jgi:AraC-like DNA-binding protein